MTLTNSGFSIQLVNGLALENKRLSKLLIEGEMKLWKAVRFDDSLKK